MNDLPPDSRPVLPPDPEPTPPKQRLRDRVWSFRAVIAVALASVIVGGLGGAALANVSDHGDDGRFGRGPGGFNRGGPGPGGPPGMMDGQGRDGMRGQPDRRGMGQRQWDEQRRPGVPPSGLPSPTLPTPSG
jgi:hypothetical protein